MDTRQFSFYLGKDPRLLPIYTIREAAHYLHIPQNTLRSWVHGRPYTTSTGESRFSAPVIELPEPVVDFDEEETPDEEAKAGRVLSLSFINLVEAHVLTAIRTVWGLPLYKAREAAVYLRGTFGSRHPFAEFDLETDKLNLFIRTIEGILNVTRGGQVEMQSVVEIFLKRIDRDAEGSPLRFYPFTRKDHFTATELKMVVIDPYISWGRAILKDAGVPTSMIIQRFWAGDSIAHLADDYGRESVEIEEAIRCELEASQ